MQKTVALLDINIGKKALVAVTGLVLFGFVIGHMLGNLQIFLGPEVFNGYAAKLKSMPALLWGVRFLLLTSLIVHTVLVIELYVRSIAARPISYRVKRNIAASYAASAMKFSGPALLLYIVFHIAHFTYPGLSLGDRPFSAHDAYSNFVSSFQVPWVTIVYVVANLLLGMHLYHGSWSLFQSLGMSHPRYNPVRQRICIALALIVTLGNVIMPLAVLAGAVS